MKRQLVIKIDEEIYNHIVDNKCLIEGTFLHLIFSVKDATPLPKGHGKLIIEPTEEEIAETIGGRNDFADCIREAVKTVFANATPIIEADKE